MTIQTATRQELLDRLSALRTEYAAVIKCGGYAPRLFVAIDNINRELAHRDRYGL